MNEEDIQSSAVTSAEQAQYITPEQLLEYGRKLVDQLSVGHTAPAEPVAHESAQGIAREAARVAASHVMELQKPHLVSQLLGDLAKQFGPEVEQELAQELMGLPASELAGFSRSPQAKRHLSRLAAGIHAERSAAPSSSPTGTVRGASVKENEMADYFMKAYGDVPGFTKEMAREMAKERL